jgi:cytochrome c556
MRSSLKLLALGAALAIVAAYSTGAPAADKEQIIKDRQSLMKSQGAALAAVKNFLDDKGDLAKATEEANGLPAKLKKIPDAFPPGSEGPNPEGKWAPKATVWSDAAGFKAQVDTAVGKADALAAAVKGGDKAKIQEAFASMGKDGCGGCHTKYREDLKP